MAFMVERMKEGTRDLALPMYMNTERARVAPEAVSCLHGMNGSQSFRSFIGVVQSRTPEAIAAGNIVKADGNNILAYILSFKISFVLFCFVSEQTLASPSHPVYSGCSKDWIRQSLSSGVCSWLYALPNVHEPILYFCQ